MVPESEESVSIAFHGKMDAAYFFFNKFIEIYNPGRPLSHATTNELFYYSDAVIFEFYAALQQLLQLINLKAGLNLPTQDVARGIFFEQLRKARKDLLDWWNAANATTEVHVLEAYRQHITHRSESILLFATEGEEGPLIAISIPIRWRFKNGLAYQVQAGESVDIKDELQRIGEKLSNLYQELKTK
jgi:hypothetical protein